MKKLLFLGAAALALVACSGGDQTKSGAANKGASAQGAATAGKPELGDFGIETKYIDKSVRPGDNFYQYVNGGWLDTFKIPDEYSSYGSFTVLFERSEDRVHNIIEDLAKSSHDAGTNEQKIGDYFSAYTDVDAINAKGLEPLQPDFARIDALQTEEDVARELARPDTGATPIGAFINVDSKDPDHYIVYLTQSGLGMPTRDYYLDPKFADQQAKYKEYIGKILSLAGVDDADAKAAKIYDLEHSMAEVEWRPDQRRNRDLTYNLKTRDELKAFAPDAPWDAMFDAAGIGDQKKVVVREDDAIQKLATLLKTTPIDTWKAYIKYHLVSSYADVLPSTIDDTNFAFYGTVLQGTPKQKERWKRGVAAIDGALGEAVGAIYVEKYFPPESKVKMQELVGNLRSALGQMISENTWMSDATKQQAQEKLSLFTPKIGYPDKWRDYSTFDVKAGDAYGNEKRANDYIWNYRVSKLNGPVDKTEWGMNPQTINAYYSPDRNEIVFPAAILQPPFFDPNADPAVNYGGIGAVIGHEVSHGFDDQGRKSDGHGFLRDWWTDEDAAKFEALADKFGAQYAKFEPIPGFPINPKLTMGENLGDLNGMAMAYRAYKISLGGKEAPIIDGFTGDQRFFMAWAQVWKQVTRDDALKQRITSDPHSPGEFRANGIVRNMDAWYKAFNVTPDEEMYLPPDQRVQIWLPTGGSQGDSEQPAQ
ncbi:MAG TPA: M13 family metallopeptidase [Parvularculaceae bacterium]|nr:M13 family metallopeptidase [Parvularculaceae bacterium]